MYFKTTMTAVLQTVIERCKQKYINRHNIWYVQVQKANASL